MRDVYRRHVTSEEERNGRLLVEKSALTFLPAEGSSFTLDGMTARVTSEACECRGPVKPHRHWFLKVNGLVAGTTVEVVRADDGAYSLRRVSERPDVGYAHARLGACTRRIAAVSTGIQAAQPAHRSSRPRCLMHALPDTHAEPTSDLY